MPRKDGGDSLAPGLFEGGQDAELVIHQDVVLGRVMVRDICEGLFLVDVDQDVAFNGFKNSGALNLARLVTMSPSVTITVGPHARNRSNTSNERG